MIDGRDIKEYNIAWLRKKFGVVQQEPALFQGSIGYNLRYFKNSATKEEINQALDVAYATEIVYGKDDKDHP